MNYTELVVFMGLAGVAVSLVLWLMGEDDDV